MEEKSSFKSFLPVIGIALLAFIFNTSEFMPTGLLSSIATSLDVSISKAGLLITVYAYAVTLLSIPIMLFFTRYSFKTSLAYASGLFSICQLLSAISPSYLALMFSRLGVATAHSLFWAIAAPAATDIVDQKRKAKAMSAVVSGTSLAIILGLPLGRVAGLYAGWRLSFAVLGLLSLLVFFYILIKFPYKINMRENKSGVIKAIIHNKVLLSIYLLTFLLISGYYTAYSYIEPFFQVIASYNEHTITLLLTLFGVAGLCGSLLFPFIYRKRRYALVCFIPILVFIVLLTLKLNSTFIALSILSALGFGLAFSLYSALFQSEIIKASSSASVAVAMAAFSAIFNLGIGSGTYLGGIIEKNIGLSYMGLIGSIFAFIATLFTILYLCPKIKERDKEKGWR